MAPFLDDEERPLLICSPSWDCVDSETWRSHLRLITASSAILWEKSTCSDNPKRSRGHKWDFWGGGVGREEAQRFLDDAMHLAEARLLRHALGGSIPS